MDVLRCMQTAISPLISRGISKLLYNFTTALQLLCATKSYVQCSKHVHKTGHTIYQFETTFIQNASHPFILTFSGNVVDIIVTIHKYYFGIFILFLNIIEIEYLYS